MTSSETTLEWVDAALAADRPTTADPAGREVQELALALRAETPEPDPAFAASLDDRVEAGFPRRIPPRRRRAFAIGGALAAAAAAAVVAVVVTSGGGGQEVAVLRSPPHSAGSSASSTEQRAAHSGGHLFAPQARTPSTAIPQARRVVRTAEMTLASPADRLQQLADDVAAATSRHHGFVQHEDVSTGGSAPGGSIELRVPVGELDALLGDVGDLGKVRARTETADDVTRQYATTSDGLARAQRQRSDLKRRIAHAGSTAEADALRGDLERVDARIRDLTSSIRALNRETNFADVQVTLQADRHSGAAGSSTRRALHDATRTFVAVVDFAIRALGVLIPLGLVIAAGALGARAVRRRRREAALA